MLWVALLSQVINLLCWQELWGPKTLPVEVVGPASMFLCTLSPSERKSAERASWLWCLTLLFPNRIAAVEEREHPSALWQWFSWLPCPSILYSWACSL